MFSGKGLGLGLIFLLMSWTFMNLVNQINHTLFLSVVQKVLQEAVVKKNFVMKRTTVKIRELVYITSTSKRNVFVKQALPVGYNFCLSEVWVILLIDMSIKM